MRALLCALLLTTTATANPSPTFTYEEGRDRLSFTAPSTIDATLRSGKRPRSCQYQLSDPELLKALLEPDVQAALRAHTVSQGPPSRLVVGADDVEWSLRAPTGPVALRLLHLRLQVEVLKAKVSCL